MRDKMEELNLEELTEFLVKAKRNSWAGNGREVEPQRPGFKEFVFKEGDLEYRDSYTGFYCAPGQEIVRFKGEPIWHMAYSGGITTVKNLELAREIFTFLKKALIEVDKSAPSRGPEFHFGTGSVEGFTRNYKYNNQYEGNITDFSGTERVFIDGFEVFKQNYIGGLVVGK